MIILIILLYTTHLTIIYDFNVHSTSLDDGWVELDKTSTSNLCGEIRYFGSLGGGFATNIFIDLKPHSHIIVEAQFISIDSNFPILFEVDSQKQNYTQLISSESSLCEGSGLEYITSFSITISHNRRTVWVFYTRQKGGLISLKLSIIKCQYECAECIENYQANCQQWRLHQYSFNQRYITQSDGWTFQPYYSGYGNCGNCYLLKFYSIKYQTQLPPHQDVLIRFYQQDSNIIIIDYLYDKFTISSHQFIEILIRNHHDPILQLNIYTQTPSESSYIRDFELFYTKVEIMFKNLNEGCLEQIDDKCVMCKEGWIQDEFQENCQPICGDGIIQGQEQCDNIISNDSCYQCKYSCIENCQICQFGVCQQCLDGFVINANFNCDPLCGDANLIPYSVEQCELGVNAVQDGCQDCRFISIANCKTNYYLICLECEVGFQMQENMCFPYCGDKLVLQQFEDCDDGNFESYDGCFQCKYSCPENCYDCHQGTCLECNDQYQLLISNQCKQQLICGDGLVQEEEECDDGNNYAADGCNDCFIEQNWVCVTMTKDSPSQCTFVKAPSLIINYLKMTQNKQYISIYFNQQVKTYTPQLLSETLNFELSDIEKKYWNSSLQIIQDVGSYLSFGEYVVEIEVYQLLKFRPLLKILVNQKVANIDNAILEDFEKQITLLYPNYLDKTQKDDSQRLKNLNKYLIYGLSGFTIISLLLRSGDLFVEILAILQFQQYLRYINLQFPQNLDIYFSINDMITVQPLLDFMQFPKFLQFIDIQSNQEYTDGKFCYYKQNSSLIINLSCQILQCLIFLFIMLLFKCVKRVLYRSIFCSRYFYYMSSLSLYISPKIILKISQFLYNICLDLLKLEKYMSFEGLQNVLLLNGWDMIFKTLLYTRNIQTKNYLDIVQLVIVSLILLLYFKILLSFFNSNQQLSQVNNKQRFKILSFGRSFFFLIFLIYVQHQQILQLGLLLLTSLLEIIFVYNYHCTFSQKQYIIQMVVEISVITFILSSFLYIEEFNEYFNQEKKIILGWIQAIILSKGIILEFLLICYGLFFKYKLSCRRKSLILKNPLFI